MVNVLLLLETEPHEALKEVSEAIKINEGCAPAAGKESNLSKKKTKAEKHHPRPGQRRMCFSWVVSHPIQLHPEPLQQLAQDPVPAHAVCTCLLSCLCAVDILLLPCVCTHPLHPGFNVGPFHAPLLPLFPSLPSLSLIELAGLLISGKPHQGQRSHWFFVS